MVRQVVRGFFSLNQFRVNEMLSVPVLAIFPVSVEKLEFSGLAMSARHKHVWMTGEVQHQCCRAGLLRADDQEIR